METSTKYGFYLPSRDTDDIADINQISDNFRKIDTDVQEKLESGKNLKTINNQSLLGSGNIEIQGGLGEADQTYSPTSPNAQSGIAVAEAVSGKMDRFGDVTAFGDINIDTGENVLHNIQILLDAPKLLLNTQDEENAELCGIATPNGTDPTQAVNVDFLRLTHDMQLLCNHAITENEAGITKFRVTPPFPIDKYYIYILYPANIETSRVFSIDGIDANNTSATLAYVTTNTNVKVSVFRGEKLFGDNLANLNWDAEYSHFKPNLYQCSWQPSYKGTNLGNIVALNIGDHGGFVEGTIILIWGRKAI